MLGRPSVVVRCRPLSVRSLFSKISSPKTAGPVEAKFHVEPPWVGGTKVCSGHLTWPRRPPRSYGKNPSKIFFSGTQKANDLGPWYIALGPWTHQSLFKWWPWLDLDLFYGKIKFGSLCFYMEKSFRKSFNGRNLQQMTRVTWGVCSHKNSDPKGLSAPGLYTFRV